MSIIIIIGVHKLYSLESDSDSEVNSNSDSDVMIMSVEPGCISQHLIRLVPCTLVSCS